MHLSDPFDSSVVRRARKRSDADDYVQGNHKAALSHMQPVLLWSTVPRRYGSRQRGHREGADDGYQQAEAVTCRP